MAEVRGRLVEQGDGMPVLRQFLVVRLRAHDQGDHARQDHQRREEHLGDGADEGGPPGGRHRVGRHRPLHDEEVGTPIAEREHEAQPHDHAEQVDPHGILVDAPSMGVQALVHVPGGKGGRGRAAVAGATAIELGAPTPTSRPRPSAPTAPPAGSPAR